MPSYPSNATSGLFLPPTAVVEVTGPTTSLEGEVLELFDSLRLSLFRYAVSYGLSSRDAEDLIQEVFLALFDHLRRGHSHRNLRGWIFRVTHNLALKRRMLLSTENRLMEEGHGSAENYSDCAPSPEAQLLFDERQARLLAVFRALPKNDQQCLRLRAEGLRYREISRMMNISLGSVSTSLTRSLARMARIDER
jgi:RNA polymerase sigma-70 factor, ECF subfamily